MVSVDYAPVAAMQAQDKWSEMGELLADSARQIDAAGADFLLICTNTMHHVAEEVEAAVSILLLHIADASGEQRTTDNLSKVALPGKAFTMQKPFYKQRIQDKFGIEVIVPDDEQQNIVHKVIYEELCLGKINQTSTAHYQKVVDLLQSRGAQSVILACTEIGLLLKP